MNKMNPKTMLFVLALLTATVVAIGYLQPVLAQQGGGGSGTGPHYNVVATEGHNLIVTDNRSNMLYFYTIDKDREVGSELKLRGQIDLSQVGKPVIMPTTHKIEK